MLHQGTVVAVDIGNSRIKLGLFHLQPSADTGLPQPAATVTLAPDSPGEACNVEPLGEWLAETISPGTPLVVASVSRPGTQALKDYLAAHHDGAWNQLRVLTNADLPIENLTDEPDRVGIDRLAAAVGASTVRRAESPAIVIDFGTAITVDLVSAEGAFAGGAILPGIGTAAVALHARTDALPAVRPPIEGKSPASVGKNTSDAIRSGLYWGAVGAVRELIARHRDGLVKPPQVLVTGSTSPDMARLLGGPDYTVRYMPHLVLAGVASTWWKLEE
ncbi:type III pantothenate kinase [Aeoliella mucimassa]|uniref:Type III pantothenate kinase n=1 Tax=Aeoliella mucimassa TaxID=2527972 RepID=A0A518AGQ6_9BACT|nr:type III pantothenate kinase [Aeoliella mucimassa]QDU53894.1 Type III pantothenate kinase [Aeoliella mucimassa]